MVYIYCNTVNYEYDIRALVMGFFPGEELCYNVKDTLESTEPIVCESEKSHTQVSIHIIQEDRKITVSSDNRGEITTMTDDVEEHASSGIYRDILKRLLYRALTKNLNKTLPWGTLTGVRPAKLPIKQLMKGNDIPGTIEHMQKEYYCSPGKAELCTQIADTELRILRDIGYEMGYSIYIGIPFCPTVCTYCSFSSTAVDGVPGSDTLMEDYITALEKECRAVSGMCSDKRLTSIYIGGGTPTALAPSELKRLMDIVKECFPVSSVYEYTVEAGRPDSITEEKLAILKAGNVTRISVNPQTMKQETLKFIGRKHTAEQTVEAYELARKLGFDNINMDLIAGLQGESAEDFGRTLEYIDRLAPDSFTVHSLVVKRASKYRQQKELEKASNPKDRADMTEAAPTSVITDFTEQVSATGTTGLSKEPSATGMTGLPEKNVTEAMLDMAADYAAKAGYRPYYMYRQKNKAGLGDNPVLENVGYAKPGKEGIYNILIMEERQTIIAIGAGASSKLVYNNSLDNNIDQVVKRIANVKNVREYISRIDEMIDRKKRWIYA